MDFIKRRLLRESLHRLADSMDKEDLAFVKEVAGDPRFARLMGHVQNGEMLNEELVQVLGERA